ncbi:MAG TPA: sigma-70 family RNA polymerase sigma factor [Candidatus Saccharimonadales bacterium]|nr:sigma-70 family RNA polymerase sigma factor [Candidatus Saccharimonadales bacterium]
MTTDDMELVRQYAAHQSESAFTALVSRHTNLVYSVALRRTGNPQLAEEVTQAVFVILARKAGSLNEKTILPSWLYRTACYVSGHAFKHELRRQQREQEAYMQSTLNEAGTDAAWKQLSPLLEDAMLRLGQTDRDALVLRFFEGRSLNEVGTALGASEDAAKKRVNRAVEKLRKFFTKHGITLSTAVIASAVSANSVQAAPAMLAKTATAVALAKGATASTSTLPLIKGALNIMAWTKAKTAIVVGVAIILATATTTTLIVQHQSQKPLAFAGYATPEASFESYLAAVNNRDTKAILACFAPEDQKMIEPMLQHLSDNDRAAFLAHKVDEVKGSHITDKKIISDNQIELTVSSPKQPAETIRLEKVRSEWKFYGNAIPRTNN